MGSDYTVCCPGFCGSYGVAVYSICASACKKRTLKQITNVLKNVTWAGIVGVLCGGINKFSFLFLHIAKMVSPLPFSPGWCSFSPCCIEFWCLQGAVAATASCCHGDSMVLLSLCNYWTFLLCLLLLKTTSRSTCIQWSHFSLSYSVQCIMSIFSL